MKQVDGRRARLQLLLGACSFAVLVSMAAMADATTIDFETPSLNGADEAWISPLEIQGVRFIGINQGILVRETVWFPCDGVSATNQAFEGWSWAGGCPEGCCPDFISIEFPGAPSDPVTHLSLEVRSYAGDLYLKTYDADGVPLSTTSIHPAPVSCPMSIRGTLETSTPRPIAVAEVWSGNPPPAGCDGCCVLGSAIVLIDNVTFDGGAVSTPPVTWGKLKALYR